MGILSWLVLGLIVGALANAVVPGRFPGGIVGTILGGIIGALVGGALFSVATGRGIEGFNLRSLGIAFIGAAILLLVLRQVGRTDAPARA